MTATAYERLVDVLENVKHPSGNQDKASANCPAHDSASRSSLSIKRTEGKALVYCFGGCTTEQILDALGWTKADLYDDGKGYTYGYSDGAYAHRGYNGEGRKKFWQSGNTSGDSTPLYRLSRVEVAKLAGQEIWLVEGEDDVHALETLGVCATTTRGGVGMKGKADLSPLYGARINAVVDKDGAGDNWARYMRTMLEGKARTLTFVQAEIGKDAADHIAADRGLGDFLPYVFTPEEAADEEPASRWVSLDQFLDGTYTPPQPRIGASREDGIQFLYPGMWHTNIALTTAGKTTFALWQVKSVLDWGAHVVYIHFEEASPNGIIHRLKGLGINTEVIRKRLHWGHVDTPWKWGELAAEIEQLEVPPQLAVLDGINAACGMHNWAVKEPESVGLYRAMFVHPLTKIGAAVLSLGHPPKATNRQSESYSYGAAGWLNDVDGVGYRMVASKTPISKGAKGASALYVVKDRYGEVQRWGELQSDKEMPWWYMGQFVVDDTPAGPDLFGEHPHHQQIQVTKPAANAEGASRDKIDTLCDHIIAHLRATTGRFETVNKLTIALRADIPITKSDIAPALQRLANRGLIEWPDVPDRKPRPGWLTDAAIDPEDG
jgi:5S rRNA maturation endonuclease (ribonuclease M5)